MRITHHGMIDRVISNVQKRMKRIEERQQHVSTGVRVDKPSTDPIAASEILALNSRINRTNQFMRNIDHGLAQMYSTESALQDVNDILIQVKAAAITGANDTSTGVDRKNLAFQVDAAISNLLTVANQKHGNRFLFGGFDSGQTPYGTTDDSNNVVDSVFVRNASPQSQINLYFDDAKLAPISVNADDVFDLGDETVFEMLFNLKNALNSNDSAVIGEALPKLEEAMAQINDLNSLVGSRVSSAKEMKEYMINREYLLTDRKSELADIDVIDAVIRLNEEQTSYELALRTAAKVIQPSLVNFVYL